MKIAVLGDGITAKAVKRKINKLDNHVISDIHSCDVIVASPGIPPAQYPRTDKPIISEIDLAYRLFQKTSRPPQYIAITGTNGKTTVTEMIAHLLDCPVAGNIGIPLIDYVPETPPQELDTPDYIAIEMSSYQLETTFDFHPNIVILTNITQDHLARHKTMEAYIKAKARIFRNQNKNDFLIYNANDYHCKEMIQSCPAQKIDFDYQADKYNIKAHLSLPGNHNLENAMAAVYSALILGFSKNEILNKLSEFQGVEHRIEFVKEIDGMEIYNDSKATNPESTITALKALGKQGIIIMGGRDKNTSLDELVSLIKTNISKTIIIGEARERFCQALRDKQYTGIYLEADITAAIKRALSERTDERYLLLSPSCSSFDMYSNFKERGLDFKKKVEELTG